MPWEINISEEGWASIRKALEIWTVSSMATALADDDFEEDLGKHGLAYAERHRPERYNAYASTAKDALIDECVDRIHRHDTCDAGSHAFWIDREGYNRVYIS